MALRTIVQDGDPILKKVCRPVTKFDDRRLRCWMIWKETLIAANCPWSGWPPGGHDAPPVHLPGRP